MGTRETFIMEGTPENNGVNFCTLQEIFQEVEEINTQYNYNISLNILEV